MWSNCEYKPNVGFHVAEFFFFVKGILTKLVLIQVVDPVSYKKYRCYWN